MEHITLSTQQAMCVEFCIDPNRLLAAVTGQAGTGKTTLIRHVANILTVMHHKRVAICAPTGKAARRIMEATGLQALTIHKLLEYGRPRDRDPDTGEGDPTLPRRDKFHPLEYDVVLCDEYSMVNQELNRNLIDALPRGSRLIMFGDVSQLSPIEQYPLMNPDSPFITHLSNPDKSFTLEQVFRQDKGSDVLVAATAIRQGRIPRKGEHFRILMTDDPVKKLRAVLADLPYNFRELENQIITPVKNRWIGTRALNSMLRNIYNPQGLHAVQLMRYTWDDKSKVVVAIGDKVVCTENTYDIRNYSDRFERFDDTGAAVQTSFIPVPDTKWMLNGETGIIIDIHPDTGMEVDFGDRVVEIPYEYEEWSERHKRHFLQYPQRAIDLAYALTTHKAQGSEYDNVVYVISKTVSFMLSRENIYTAVTRARKSAHVITDSNALMISLRVTREIAHKRDKARAARAKSIISPTAKIVRKS